MSMVFCQCCGKQIHESAPTCPHCGGLQAAHVQNARPVAPAGPLWMPIASLVLGIVCVLALFDDSDWDRDTILGLGLFSTAGLVLGALSLHAPTAGKGLAIAGTVMSAVCLLIFVGMLVS